MNTRLKRALGALVLTLATAALGYNAGGGGTPKGVTPSIPSVTITAPPPGSIRIVYSLDKKQNNKEIIALIDAAKTHIYFAIYTFTLRDVAEALVAAKKRGVEVRGLVDSGQAAETFSKPVMQLLTDAGISVVTEKHETGNGIMHIKMIVTDSAYALGSYNWTNSATTINDEIIEIGTDETLRQTYENILKKLLDAYAGNDVVPLISGTTLFNIGTIDYTEAPNHIGETASVRGTLVKSYTSASGTTFLDFCTDYKTCPFTAVIFSSDAKKFTNLSSYTGSTITLTGKISSYQGKAEIILSDPSQISK